MKKLFCFLLTFIYFLQANNDLTLLEKQWIKNNPIVKVGIDQNWPPFDFVNKNKQAQGISSEYLKIITKETGLSFDIHASDWTDILKLIQDKKLDILSAAVPTEKRKEYLSFTDSYLDLDVIVLAKKDLEIKEFNEIEKYKVVVQEDNFVHEILKKRFLNIKFMFVKSNLEAFKAVSYGQADIFIGNLPVVTYFKQKELLTNLEIKFKADIKKSDLGIAVLKEKTILYNIINKTLKNVKEEQREKINNKWIFKKANENKIKYTQKELVWIREHKEVKIAGDASWAPFSFYKEDKYIGIVPDMISLIETYGDLKFKYINTKEWRDTLKLFKEDKILLIDAISKSRENKKNLSVSSEYFASHIVIVGNNDESYLSSLSEIKNSSSKKIGVIEDYTITKNIKENSSHSSQLIYFKSPKEALLSLSDDLIDYFIIDIPTFEYYSKKYSLSNLKILGPTGFQNHYGLGVKPDNLELLSIINKTLKYIPQEEKDKVYRKWIKIKYEEKIDYELIWKIIIIALFALAGTIYWNRRLKAEIAKKEIIQKDLQESKNFIHSIMDSQENIVIVTDGICINKANKAFFDFTKYKDLEDFKKEHNCISNLFCTNDANKYIKAKKGDTFWLNNIVNNTNDTHKVLIYKEEKEHIFKVSASLISNNSSLRTLVFTDITKLEELNKMLVKTKNEALDATKHKSEFLANMSHEIRTPMNSVIGFTELLDKEITNPIQKEYLSSIKKGGTSLLRIINDILDLSKIEAGKLEIKNESINPKNLFFEIKSIFDAKIMSKNINFIVEIDESIPDYIIIDSVRLRQILFNLIGNALKFTENGYIKLKVKNVYKDNAKSKIDLNFQVEDSGIGIDEKFQDIIFNAFEQQKDQSVEKFGGTGLGLAICSKLAKMMNGEISVKSVKTKGSTFNVLLKDISVSSISAKIDKIQKIDTKHIIFEKATILVVDDILENRKLVKETLKNYELELMMAVNGEDAIKKLRTNNIDLILMDLRMPIMNGYEASHIIKNEEKLKEIPLIALTASVMEKDLKKVSSYGFDAYLRKPVILDDLIIELSKYLKYSMLNEKKEVINRVEVINQSDLKKLILHLENSFLVNFLEIKDSGDFTLIEDFATKLKVLAENYKLLLLEEYILDLEHYIKSFDIEKVDFMMNSFPVILEKIRALKGASDE